jgi:16S rRNA (uracil1498-N3)-methyltransferase
MTPRLYCPDDLSRAVQITLPDAAAHHVARVLRLRTGDLVTLFDGSGGEYAASIHEVSKKEVVVDVGKFSDVERESPLRITLAQGLSVSDKMDDTLQKAVQLGIAEFAPIDTQKSIVRLSDERAQKRFQHWQQVAISACEQSGRNRIPLVREVSAFADFVQTNDAKATRLLLSPRGDNYLNKLNNLSSDIILLCGPEAGLSDSEETLAINSGFIPVRLGPRILRTETAAVAALAAMNALWGDYSFSS